jgi:nucleotide-binding universal stress UspA family protein
MEMHLSKILLPVDFSERSDAAAHYAKTLACRFHSGLTIVHVFELPDLIIVGPEAAISPEWHDERRADLQRKLNEFHANQLSDLPVRRVLLEGNVARSIVDFAHAEGVDLIVMPTHGYGPFSRFLIGSVTAKVLHDAACAVLTGVHIDPPPGVETITFGNIICAVDFNEAGERAARWAGQFALEFGAHLIVVHALPPPDVGPARYLDQTLPATLRQMAEQRLDELQNHVGTNAEIVLDHGRVAEVVRNAATTRQGDLVVIGRHESPGLLGRLRADAYAIVRESPCPVVSV